MCSHCKPWCSLQVYCSDPSNIWLVTLFLKFGQYQRKVNWPVLNWPPVQKNNNLDVCVWEIVTWTASLKQSITDGLHRSCLPCLDSRSDSHQRTNVDLEWRQRCMNSDKTKVTLPKKKSSYNHYQISGPHMKVAQMTRIENITFLVIRSVQLWKKCNRSRVWTKSNFSWSWMAEHWM